jgi:paired amphipathic helix protein Sin3a
VKEEEAQQKSLFVKSNIQYKICRDTYHMFYIIGTEDILMRPTQPSIPIPPSSPNIKWKSWLESDQGWSKGITDKDQAEKEARQLLFSPSL